MEASAKEIAKAERAFEKRKEEHQRFLASSAQERERLSSEYSAAKDLLGRLQKEVALVEENLEDISFGLYKPHFTFETSAEFKQALEQVHETKKDMVRAGSAATCAKTWTVGNSAREGERMTKQLIKVMLRAFNGEVDAAVAKVDWNNAPRMEERIKKAHAAINTTGAVIEVTIAERYLQLALDELRLTFEYAAKKRAEQEEQRRIREQMREEERAQREFEKAKADAEADEARFEKALEKARAEVERAQGAALDKVNTKVAELEAKLAEAHAKMERAKSMAQLTKSGNVYVISNIGSFGESIFKIGMTRRLEPMERIYELGDASVPFEFDVHAMIYSDDAPGLEASFHQHFAEKRVNMVNERKEFFQVTLADIESFAKEHGVTVTFTQLAEAREYRETLALREARAKSGVLPTPPKPSAALPDQLFPVKGDVAA